MYKTKWYLCSGKEYSFYSCSNGYQEYLDTYTLRFCDSVDSAQDYVVGVVMTWENMHAFMQATRTTHSGMTVH